MFNNFILNKVILCYFLTQTIILPTKEPVFFVQENKNLIFVKFIMLEIEIFLI